MSRVASSMDAGRYSMQVTLDSAPTTTSIISATNWTVTARDTASDGQFVSAPFQVTNGYSDSVVNNSGAYTSETLTIAGDASNRLQKVKSCRSNTAWPMSCSGWAMTGY